MLERLAPKLVGKFRDIELLEYIGRPLHPTFVPRFNEFCAKLQGERAEFHGDSVDYLVMLLHHCNRTFERFVSLGGFTRSHLVASHGAFIIPGYFSPSDQFSFNSVIEKLTNPAAFGRLVTPLSEDGESMFSEVRRNAFFELQRFEGTACAYFLLQLMQLHVALSEVIALHKFGPKE